MGHKVITLKQYWLCFGLYIAAAHWFSKVKEIEKDLMRIIGEETVLADAIYADGFPSKASWDDALLQAKITVDMRDAEHADMNK